MTVNEKVHTEPSGHTRKLTGGWRVLLLVFAFLGVVFAINQVFQLRPFGMTIIENSYFYLLAAFFLPLVFLLYPAFKSSSRIRIPWYDIVLFLVSFGISAYLVTQGMKIVLNAWAMAAPLVLQVLSLILWLLILEAGRRTGGMSLAIFCAILSSYPIFADYMPGFLEGIPFSLWNTASYHVLGTQSAFGITMDVFGKTMIGFMLFSVALVVGGGGRVFYNLALALMGKARGAPAKVGVIASALFGTMSGSVISNVLSAGSLSIPAMKKGGYSPAYAAGVEACASTGGVLMPPVMGATAFIMASFLGLPYAIICLAAAAPSILYYSALFFQVDAHAATHGLGSMQGVQLPPIKDTLKEGWYLFVAIIVLVFTMAYMNREAQSPFLAAIILVIPATIKGVRSGTLGRFLVGLLEGAALTLADLVAILLIVGLVIGSLSMTGVAHAFTQEFVALAGNNTTLLLVLGAFTSFILGMGMTISACYVFLAIVLAPALTSQGFDPVAVHLFVMYWGMLSFISPPVALGAFAAAGIAGSSPIKTGFIAMRLGFVAYMVPFFFVLDPAMILRGPFLDIIQGLGTMFIGIILLTGAVEGYLIGIGKVTLPVRVLLLTAGLSISFPDGIADLVGAAIAVVAIVVYRLTSKERTQARPSGVPSA